MTNPIIDYWTTKEGKKIKYKNLATDHLNNIISLLKRNSIKGVHAHQRVFVETGYGGDSYIPDYETVHFVLKGKEYLEHFNYESLLKEQKRRGI